jgi:hypothetical protein
MRFLVWLAVGDGPGMVKVNVSSFKTEKELLAGADQIRTRRGFPRSLSIDPLWRRPRLMQEIRHIPEDWFACGALKVGYPKDKKGKIDEICGHILQTITDLYRKAGYAEVAE